MPEGFSFLNGTNSTNATTSDYGITFTNSSTVLSWNSTLASGTGAVLVANATRVNFWFLINASIPGTYNMTVTTMNVSGFINRTNISITVNDTTAPNNITFQGQTPTNNSFVRGNSVFVNASIYDNGAIQTVIINLMNSSGTFVNTSGSGVSTSSNQTTISNISQENKLQYNFTLNFSNLAEGVYFLNLTVNDTYGNSNITMQTITITLDRTLPSVTLGETTSTDSSISVPVTVSDSMTTINGTCTVNRAGATVTGTGTSQTLSESGLTCSTTYSYTITCLDQAGNANAATKDFTTLGCNSGSGAGGGGGGASSSTPSWSTVQTITEAQFTEGVTSSLKSNERVVVTVEGEKHTVGVVSIDSGLGQAIIEVASTPKKATLRVGQTYQFEMNNDTYYDLNVTLQSITAGKANVTMKKVHELLPSAIVASDGNKQDPQVQNSVPVDEQKQDEKVQDGTKKTLLSDIYTYLLIGLIVIIVIVVVLQRRRR